MKQQTIHVDLHSSAVLDELKIIVTLRFDRTGRGVHELAIGWPGVATRAEPVRAGDAFLYEATEHGVIEVRVLSIGIHADILLTPISPTPGLLVAGADSRNGENSPFAVDEVARITASLQSVKQQIHQLNDVSSAQLAFLAQKLDEIGQASSRLGRKDWINYAVGALTSALVSAAFAPDAAKAILTLIADALSWLSGSSLTFLLTQ